MTTVETCEQETVNEKPALEELGLDLLVTSRRQRWLTLSRPVFLIALYAALASWGQLWALPIVVFLIFVAIVTAAHDVVHGAIGLSPRQTDLALALLGAVLFESGHAYRRTHHRHHEVFPGPDDPEGEPAKTSWQRAILGAPLFLPKLWCWAFERSRGRTGERLWLIGEALWFLVGFIGAILLLDAAPMVSGYFLMVVVGSWSYPLLTVHLPHRNYGDTPVRQTHTLRGTIMPRLFLELTYHLEHHLYPEVPSHHLPDLSRRGRALAPRAGRGAAAHDLKPRGCLLLPRPISSASTLRRPG